jgi:hypothetical protein
MTLEGKIIGNKYINTEPRWYVILKECPKTILVQRLKDKEGPEDKFGNTIFLPGTTPYGSVFRLRKCGSYFKSKLEGPVVMYNGNYGEWEEELSSFQSQEVK